MLNGCQIDHVNKCTVFLCSFHFIVWHASVWRIGHLANHSHTV